MASAGDFDYDVQDHNYAARRRTDPRIARLVHEALGDARWVLNVGAGTGSYEPEDRGVLAVEPSAAMRARRPADLPPAIDAVAEELPFDDGAFDAGMAIATVHQWGDASKGLGELRRVARGPVVILTFDGAALDRFWLADYVPELMEQERRRLPPVEMIRAAVGPQATVRPVAVPADCVDGFIEAFYARPEAFLEEDVRRSQSAWAFVDDDTEARFVRDLREDLSSGAWEERYGHWRSRPTFECALRLVVGGR